MTKRHLIDNDDNDEATTFNLHPQTPRPRTHAAKPTRDVSRCQGGVALALALHIYLHGTTYTRTDPYTDILSHPRIYPQLLVLGTSIVISRSVCLPCNMGSDR